jgi:hypothetical protein
VSLPIPFPTRCRPLCHRNRRSTGDSLFPAQENHRLSTPRIPQSPVNVSPSSLANGVPLSTLSSMKIPPPLPSSMNSALHDSLFDWSTPPCPSRCPQAEGLAATHRRSTRRLTIDETWPRCPPSAPHHRAVSMVSSR